MLRGLQVLFISACVASSLACVDSQLASQMRDAGASDAGSKDATPDGAVRPDAQESGLDATRDPTRDVGEIVDAGDPPEPDTRTAPSDAADFCDMCGPRQVCSEARDACFSEALGETAAQWGVVCNDAAGCGTEKEDTAGSVDGTAVRIYTYAAKSYQVFTPPAKDLALDVSPYDTLFVAIRAENVNRDWDLPSPHVRLTDSSGNVLVLAPTQNLLGKEGNLQTFEIPLAGGGDWSASGLDEFQDVVDALEMVFDTTSFGFTIWIERIEFR